MENLLFTATTDGCFQGREQPGNNADGSDDLVKFIAGKCLKKTQNNHLCSCGRASALGELMGGPALGDQL